VRFGLIGAGGRGLEIFKYALRAPNTQAIAVADVYSRQLEEAKRLAPTIQTYTDFRRLLDDKSVDAVLIATPQHQHALNFVPAIQAGKDVYQEKTMAFNPDHATTHAPSGGRIEPRGASGCAVGEWQGLRAGA